jgi:DNA-binding Xre family transcriptional regulator
MIHRHLDYAEGTPVAALGDAALDDLLDRGDLNDWRPLAKAIATDPFGDLAERVLRLCDANPRYGTSSLWRAWIARRRAATTALPSPPVSLAQLRRQRGMSQAELAARIGMSQSDLSKAERRSDWKLSTITAIAEGLGLRARLVVEDDEGRVVGTIVAAQRIDPATEQPPAERQLGTAGDLS